MLMMEGRRSEPVGRGERVEGISEGSMGNYGTFVSRFGCDDVEGEGIAALKVSMNLHYRSESSDNDDDGACCMVMDNVAVMAKNQGKEQMKERIGASVDTSQKVGGCDSPAKEDEACRRSCALHSNSLPRVLFYKASSPSFRNLLPPPRNLPLSLLITALRLFPTTSQVDEKVGVRKGTKKMEALIVSKNKHATKHQKENGLALWTGFSLRESVGINASDLQ
ncbi:hypothetical protein SESBI_43560 [Sesbania bispinosa]|nr:hypothetical protein SESBI_43560 [Sesbania bispinosa]